MEIQAKNATIYSLKYTANFLESLDIHPEINALWEFIHFAKWHQGVDITYWVKFNEKLIYKIIKYDSRIHMPNDLKKEVYNSIFEIKKLDR